MHAKQHLCVCFTVCVWYDITYISYSHLRHRSLAATAHCLNVLFHRIARYVHVSEHITLGKYTKAVCGSVGDTSNKISKYRIESEFVSNAFRAMVPFGCAELRTLWHMDRSSMQKANERAIDSGSATEMDSALTHREHIMFYSVSYSQRESSGGCALTKLQLNAANDVPTHIHNTSTTGISA